MQNPGPPGGAPPFGARQMAALEAILAQAMARWSIPPERVLGHSDVAPGRKTDPGPKFDWRRLALSGLAVWPGEAEAAPESLFASLAALGYDPGAARTALIGAAQLRFLPEELGLPVTRRLAGRAAEAARRWPAALTQGGPSA